jgi:hypothetical protein
VLSP